MRAVRVSEHGDVEVLRWEDVPRPEPGDGQVLVRVLAVGLAWGDLVQIEGTYHGGGPPLPFTPGWEVAGEVVASGDDAGELEVGARVFAVLLEPGAFAEYLVAPARLFERVPAWMTDAEASVSVVPYYTADAALSTVARLQPGEAVVVQAGAGGVGAAAIQLCRALGADPIIATAGTGERRDAAVGYGAHVAVGYDELIDTALRHTGGRGVDVVLESVGGEAFDQSLQALAPLGRLVSIGATGGQPPRKLKLPVLWHNSVHVSGLHVSHWLQEHPQLLEPTRRRVRDLLARRQVFPVVGATFPGSAVGEAFRALRSREVLGRIAVNVASQEL